MDCTPIDSKALAGRRRSADLRDNRPVSSCGSSLGDLNRIDKSTVGCWGRTGERVTEAADGVSETFVEPPRSVDLTDLRFGTTLAAIAVLVGVGSFGTWSVLQPRRVATYYTYPIISFAPDSWGIQRWRGPGWLTLVFAVFSMVFVLLAVTKPTSERRVVAVAFLTAVVVVATYNLIDILCWNPDGIPFTVGWGLWLCFGAAILGVGIGTVWIRRARGEARG